jgi:2-hydroxychromene-2-carboxylate isomerase
MKTVEWYFDFVSPFSYLAMEQSHRLPKDIEITFTPILFAGLLKHWNHKGPAEIPEKRRFTVRHVQWLANKHGIPLKAPSAHPFNPLAVLRLSIVLNNDPEIIREIFRFIWRDGRRPDEPDSWQDLAHNLNVKDADERVTSPDIKDELRSNGERALQLGVFGVPTFVVDNELFWGFDALDFVSDYLLDPRLLESDEMRRVSQLPIGAQRRP